VTTDDWSSYDEAEQRNRSVICERDQDGIDPLYRYTTPRMSGQRYIESGKFISKQMIFDRANKSIPIYSRYDRSEPYHAKTERLDGSLAGLFDLGDSVLSELLETMKDGALDLVDVPINSDDILLSTNELLRPVDSRTGFGAIMKTDSVNYKYQNGDWKQGTHLINVSKRKSPYDTLWWTDALKATTGGGRDENSVTPDSEVSFTRDFVHALEVNDLSYSDSDDDYWILLGGTQTSGGYTAMQESVEGRQLIAKAERTIYNGYAYLFAVFTEQNILGEWIDAFKIWEIGIYKGASQPAYNATLDARVALKIPSVATTGYVDNFVGSGEIYRPPPWFLRNSRFGVTFGHVDVP